MILSGYRLRTCPVYIGDTIIYSPTAEKHLNDVEKVLDALQSSGVSLNFEKCFFFKDVVRYLRHIIKQVRLEINNAHVTTLTQEKPPKKLYDLRSY